VTSFIISSFIPEAVIHRYFCIVG